MKRLHPTKRLRHVTSREISELARHFERWAKGVATAADLALRSRLEDCDKKRRWTDLTSVKEALELSHALYEGGRITWDEYFFYSVLPVESLHDHLTFNGHYDGKLGPISKKMEDIETEYGLKPGEYWLKGQGPAEHNRLTARYEKVLSDEFGKLLREVGLHAHARLWRNDREKFDQLREAGRASVFEPSNVEHATAKLIEMYESEATKCAKAKAYYAACVMLGSASEAVILFKCLQEPAELAAAMAKTPNSKRFHKGGPQFWNLSQLVEIAKQAGWLTNLQTENVVVHIVNLMSHFHEIRNLVHPGRHATSKPHVSIGKEQYADAKAAYLALRLSLERTMQVGKSRVKQAD